MGSKQIRNVAFIVGSLGFLYWLNKKTKVQAKEEVAKSINLSPEEQFFAANPNAFKPADISISVTGPQVNMYGTHPIPLFGFVGVAQGAMWQ